jgi:hypothetical protein
LIEWVPREPPLAPRAVVAVGLAAARLVRTLLRRDALGLASLAGVASEHVVVIASQTSEAELPWAAEVEYLGCDGEAPGFWVPTTLAPTMPLALVERVYRRATDDKGPLGLLPGPPARLIQAWLDRAT